MTVKPPAPKEVNVDSLSYYKHHPKYIACGIKLTLRYVLERHLRRDEALKPGCKPVRTFTSGKGEKAREEVVYNRKDVYTCRTVETWYNLPFLIWTNTRYKEGKKVKVQTPFCVS